MAIPVRNAGLLDRYLYDDDGGFRDTRSMLRQIGMDLVMPAAIGTTTYMQMTGAKVGEVYQTIATKASSGPGLFAGLRNAVLGSDPLSQPFGESLRVGRMATEIPPASVGGGGVSGFRVFFGQTLDLITQQIPHTVMQAAHDHPAVTATAVAVAAAVVYQNRHAILARTKGLLRRVFSDGDHLAPDVATRHIPVPLAIPVKVAAPVRQQAAPAFAVQGVGRFRVPLQGRLQDVPLARLRLADGRSALSFLDAAGRPQMPTAVVAGRGEILDVGALGQPPIPVVKVRDGEHTKVMAISGRGLVDLPDRLRVQGRAMAAQPAAPARQEIREMAPGQRRVEFGRPVSVATRTADGMTIAQPRIPVTIDGKPAGMSLVETDAAGRTRACPEALLAAPYSRHGNAVPVMLNPHLTAPYALRRLNDGGIGIEIGAAGHPDSEWTADILQRDLDLVRAGLDAHSISVPRSLALSPAEEQREAAKVLADPYAVVLDDPQAAVRVAIAQAGEQRAVAMRLALGQWLEQARRQLAVNQVFEEQGRAPGMGRFAPRPGIAFPTAKAGAALLLDSEGRLNAAAINALPPVIKPAFEHADGDIAKAFGNLAVELGRDTRGQTAAVPVHTQVQPVAASEIEAKVEAVRSVQDLFERATARFTRVPEQVRDAAKSLREGRLDPAALKRAMPYVEDALAPMFGASSAEREALRADFDAAKRMGEMLRFGGDLDPQMLTAALRGSPSQVSSPERVSEPQRPMGHGDRAYA